MEKFLGIYLNDQLASGILWRELARRSQRNNSGTELGDALTRVSTGIAEDVNTFQQIMHRLGIGINPMKIGLAVAAERLGRLKPNGRMNGYSPLSRFLELDVHLIKRADQQRVDLEPFRARAGTDALTAASRESGITKQLNVPAVALSLFVAPAPRQGDQRALG